MARGSSLSDTELAALGVTRNVDEFGRSYYTIPCDVCGKPISLRTYSTDKAHVCRLCKSGVVEKRNAAAKAEKERIERIMASGFGVGHEHYRRFEKGASKFDDSYIDDIEKARKAIDRFDSIPEVVACIELLHIGTRVIAHQKVGDFTVDFCLPDEKLVVEIDGSLYHADADKEYMRDFALMHMLGDGWDVRHVPADAVMKNHKSFGRNMKKMLNARRGELGIKRL